MFRKKIQAASGSFQYRRPTQILRPHHALRTKCFASQQNTQPWALETPGHIAHTQPCANRPTSPTSPTSPTFFAHSIGFAQCALPAGGNALCSLVNAMHRDILPNFCALRFGISGAHSPHIALCQSSVQVRTSPYKSVFPCPHPVPCAKCFASQQNTQPCAKSLIRKNQSRSQRLFASPTMF